MRKTFFIEFGVVSSVANLEVAKVFSTVECIVFACVECNPTTAFIGVEYFPKIWETGEAELDFDS